MLLVGPLLTAQLVAALDGADGGEDGFLARQEVRLASFVELLGVGVPRGSLAAVFAVALAALLTPCVLHTVDAALLTAADTTARAHADRRCKS